MILYKVTPSTLPTESVVWVSSEISAWFVKSKVSFILNSPSLDLCLSLLVITYKHNNGGGGGKHRVNKGSV